MNIIAVCNTPLQIICALNIKNKIYPNDVFDVVISDHINNSKAIAENANKHRIFDSAIYAKTFVFCRGKKQLYTKGIAGLYCRAFYKEKILKKMICIDKKYDIMLFNNFDIFNKLLYQVLREKNKKIKTYMMEDGYSSYYAQGWEWEAAAKQCTGFKYFLKKKILGEYEIAESIIGQYVYEPETVKWKAPFKRLRLPKLDLSNKTFLSQLNKLFDYYKVNDSYDKPIIFFEESFRKEGYDIGDIEMVETIANIVGKNNIMIKRHPRNTDNIFEKMGYRVNKNTIVPWEVIIMNNPDMTEKILVTICSGAAATPYTMFGMQTNSVILLNLIKNREKINYKFYDIYFNYMNSAVFKKHPEVFYMPQTFDELQEYFAKWKEKQR